MLTEMIFSVEGSLFKRPLLAHGIIMYFVVGVVRVRRSAEYTFLLSTNAVFETVGANPTLERKMEGFLVTLPIMLRVLVVSFSSVPKDPSVCVLHRNL